MENEIVSAGRFASVEIVSRHLTSINNYYAVRKELMLPVPNSTEKRKILARDALIMYRNSVIEENWHVPFLAPLGYEQRMYHIPLDMFQWPHKIIVHTPNSVALPTPGCRAGMDVLIRAHNVPKFIWLELVYKKTGSTQPPDVSIHEVQVEEKDDSNAVEEDEDDQIYWEEMLSEEHNRCEE
jgi:hypothetical protein